MSGLGNTSLVINEVGAGLAVDSVGAAVATTDVGHWYCYQAASGAYYAVNRLTGLATYSHATDFSVVFNAIIAAMVNTTNNAALSGGDIELGAHIFNCANPLAITKRGVKVHGQGRLQGTILAQIAGGTFAAASGILQVGTSGDSAVLQGIHLRDFAIRGMRGDGTVTTGAGLVMYVAWSVFENIVIAETNDGGIVLNGVSSSQKGYSNVVRDVHVLNYGRTGVHTADGVFLGTNLSDSDFIGLYVFQGGSGPAERGQHGIHLNGSTTGSLRFLNCHTYFNRQHGIFLEAGADVYVANCISESNGNNAFRSSIDGLTVTGGGYYCSGIYTDATGSTRTPNDASNVFDNMFLQGKRIHISNLRFDKRIASNAGGGELRPNVPRNIDASNVDGLTIDHCSFIDAWINHILINTTGGSPDSHAVIIDSNYFAAVGRTYGADPVGTVSTAVLLAGTTTNSKVINNIIEGAAGLVENGGSACNYNEFTGNKFITSGGTVTLVGTSSRKWNNRDQTNVLLPDRVVGGHGGNVASAGTVTLGHGRSFDITGNTNIDRIETVGVDSGLVFCFNFVTGTMTVSNATAASGTALGIKFKSGAALTPAAGATMQAYHDGAFWKEV